MKSKIEQIVKKCLIAGKVESESYSFCNHFDTYEKTRFSVWPKIYSPGNALAIEIINGSMKLVDMQFSLKMSGIELYKIRQDINAHIAKMEKIL